MRREQVMSVLRLHLHEIRREFRVTQLALFGSAARDEMQLDSDVDILVTFEGVPTFDGYMDLKTYLEQLIGTSVDLVTESAVKPRMRPVIEKDLLRVA
ncbi:MAG: nucleotidyltransferase family protein [Nitrospira sp.]|nr:nucleotidyltransferase family protein [Nitrospira sp.]